MSMMHACGIFEGAAKEAGHKTEGAAKEAASDAKGAANDLKGKTEQKYA